MHVFPHFRAADGSYPDASAARPAGGAVRRPRLPQAPDGGATLQQLLAV